MERELEAFQYQRRVEHLWAGSLTRVLRSQQCMHINLIKMHAQPRLRTCSAVPCARQAHPRRLRRRAAGATLVTSASYNGRHRHSSSRKHTSARACAVACTPQCSRAEGTEGARRHIQGRAHLRKARQRRRVATSSSAVVGAPVRAVATAVVVEARAPADFVRRRGAQLLDQYWRLFIMSEGWAEHMWARAHKDLDRSQGTLTINHDTWAPQGAHTQAPPMGLSCYRVGKYLLHRRARRGAR